MINTNTGDAADYTISAEEMDYHIIGVVLDQKFSLKDGLKKFGNTGEESSVKGLTQLHDMTTFITLDPNILTREDRIKSLSSLMFIAEKRDGTTQSRTCADGSKQIIIDSHNKHDYTPPTCADNNVMITAALEAQTFREVAIIDIPGAYLHTYFDKNGEQRIVIFLEGEIGRSNGYGISEDILEVCDL